MMHSGVISKLQPGQLIIEESDHSSLLFTWDAATLWLIGNGMPGNAADFKLGDHVSVVAMQNGASLYAMQVAKLPPNLPPPMH